MLPAEDILEVTAKMDAFAVLRYMISERFRQRTVATCSLRGRSVVVLKMIAEIDPATPVVFCHVPDPLPQSLEYRAWLVDRLGLRGVREPSPDDGPVPDDCNHSEALWAENADDHTRAYAMLHLNRTLADFDCWIRAAYHCPYPDAPGPRVAKEGRLIRIDPLADWTQEQVRQFMAEHGLPYHPQAMLRRRKPSGKPAEAGPSYHY